MRLDVVGEQTAESSINITCQIYICILDSSGNMVLSAMISKMPEVASEALEQLSHYNRRHRKQIHYINEVVPSPEEIQMESKDQV